MEPIAILGIITSISLAVGLVALFAVCSWAEDLNKIKDLEKRIQDLENKHK